MSTNYPIPEEVTRWFNQRETDCSPALPDLFNTLYGDLKRRAHFALRDRHRSATLNTTGLVNEAFIRLTEAHSLDIHDRSHFLALASKTMRWVVMDLARARGRLCRGGELERVTLNEAQILSEQNAQDLIHLDEALDHLKKLDARLAEVVEHRFFGGLSVEETATVLGISARTVKRDWNASKAFLARWLARDSP